MNKKIIAGAVIALAAGVATFIYRKNRNRINAAAEDAYDTLSDGLYSVEERTENLFS